MIRAAVARNRAFAVMICWRWPMVSYSDDSRPAKDFAADARQSGEAELLPLEVWHLKL